MRMTSQGPVSSWLLSTLPALHMNMQLIYLLRRGMRRIIPKETLTGNSD